MVARMASLIVSIAVLPSLVACGSSQNGARPATGISAHDQRVLARIQDGTRAWGKAATPWVRAFNGDDLKRFLSVHHRSLKPLNAAVVLMEAGAREIGDPRLRNLIVPISHDYRAEFDAIVDIG